MRNGADFTSDDLAQLAARGITVEEARRQLELLRHRPPAIVLDRPCTIGDGITTLDASDDARWLDAAAQAAAAGRVMKFVPASGAATRMFKDLIAALSGDDAPSTTEAGRRFFDRLDDFPFAGELRRRAGLTGPIAGADAERAALRTLLYEMRYAELPKALIAFHRVTRVRTPFEEHLLEGAQYTRDGDGTARTHFTVAPEFRAAFEQTLAEVTPLVAAATGGTRADVSFSEQHPSTDTLAITPEGEPFRAADGTLLFRPAGHGALVPNLQALDAELVVVKNIDNVLPFERCGEVVAWKRRLIGYAAVLQREVCTLADSCASDAVTGDDLDRALRFVTERFGRVAPSGVGDRSALQAFVLDALDRPLRVCGVVRNEGEPGGAPFWVVDPDGRRSRQIVESSQVDLAQPAQRRIFESSTHFNPVDLVCVLRDRRGRPYDLARFVDPSAVFLSQKSYDGRDLIALERPGLWNGAMAGWNTVFVEVPGTTFAPVKTVFDLLRPEHQSL